MGNKMQEMFKDTISWVASAFATLLLLAVIAAVWALTFYFPTAVIVVLAAFILWGVTVCMHELFFS